MNQETCADETLTLADPRCDASPRTAPQSLSRNVTGKYEVLRILGAGGMGEIYLARDRSLDRPVALKILRRLDHERVARLIGEARAQARVDHPHVAKVYEVGESPAGPFIAMQYVPGETLYRASSEMSLRDKVEVLRTAAEALDAAHREGLIHRDVKPGNILVVRDPEGVWRPYVVDFGLAREVAAPGLTRSGIAVGTPHYMAPEQARGEIQSLDRRTDVYGLGATLYELLTGQPPFDGDSSVGKWRRPAPSSRSPICRPPSLSGRRSGTVPARGADRSPSPEPALPAVAAGEETPPVGGGGGGVFTVGPGRIRRRARGALALVPARRPGGGPRR